MRRLIQNLIVYAILSGSVLSVGYANETNVSSLASTFDRLLPQLLSTNLTDVAKAHVTLVAVGETLFPRLIEEMNKPEYISQEKDLKKLGDQEWLRRLRLASVIQDISKQDFLVNTTAHGWNADVSFDRISDWWGKQKRIPNQVPDTARKLADPQH